MSKSWKLPENNFISSDSVNIGNTSTTLTNYIVPIDKGGTGAINVTSARSNLGLGTLATLNNIGAQFYNETFEVDNITVSASTPAEGYIPCAKEGYKTLGVMGTRISNASSGGTRYGWCHLSCCYMSVGTTSAYYKVNCTTSNDAKVKVRANVLFVKI